MASALEAFTALADRMSLSEWSRERSPTYRRWLDNVGDVLRRKVEMPLMIHELNQNLATAAGFGLDHIGERIGYVRPNIVLPARVFGFAAEDSGFDQSPFFDEEFEAVTEQPVGDEIYRRLLRGRGYQLLSSGSLPDLTRITDAIFDYSNWRTVGPKLVAFEACSTTFQVLQIARRTGLLEPPAGTERQTLYGLWALAFGREEVIRVLVNAGAADTLYDEAADTGAIIVNDEIINENAGNELASIEWDDANDLLTLTAQGADNALTTWLTDRSIQASILAPDGTFEQSVTITAPTDQSLAVEFASSSIFPLTAGDDILIVIAETGTVEQTGDDLFVVDPFTQMMMQSGTMIEFQA